MGKLRCEIKDWKKHWKLSRFFQVLIFGLAVSLFDTGTDFNFVWNVPETCHAASSNITECEQDFDFAQVSSSCGMYHYKAVERITYTNIAYPGFFLGFSSLQNLVTALFSMCWSGKVHRSVRGLASALAVGLECFLFLGIFVAASGQNGWPCALPRVAQVYDCTIQGMAYLSATFTIGVKCLGTFCHGPTSCCLYLRAKRAETLFEAAFQLGLLSRIYLSSGKGTTEGLLSAISSFFAIGKSGVQNFLQRHDEKLSESSILGKICIAASVLPVFLLTSVFKLGAAASNGVWNGSNSQIANIFAVGLPILIILFLKMCNRLKDLPMAQVNQSVISDLVSLHLWPKSRDGKRIGLVMAVFIFFPLASRLPFLIASPEPTTRWTSTESNNHVYKEWASKTGVRLQTASISLLLIESVTFVLVICLLLFEDKWVAKIISKFPEHSAPENNLNEGPPELVIEPENTTSNNPSIEDEERHKRL